MKQSIETIEKRNAIYKLFIEAIGDKWPHMALEDMAVILSQMKKKDVLELFRTVNKQRASK
tara:strand:+ start:356 stop:538 length:183 start_codon:yes stop_codon:yes gene_type:complete